MNLTEEENTEMFSVAHLITRKLSGHFKTEEFALTVQDGEAAGQTVPHVHLHLIPSLQHKSILEAEQAVEYRTIDQMEEEA